MLYDVQILKKKLIFHSSRTKNIVRKTRYVLRVRNVLENFNLPYFSRIRRRQKTNDLYPTGDLLIVAIADVCASKILMRTTERGFQTEIFQNDKTPADAR